jgi:hypothetical protein
MGLDCSHGCWHGAYSAFMRWREKLAEVAGLPPLLLMEGFFRKGEYTDPIKEYAKMFPNLGESFYNTLPISWECLKPDILYELLYHSDCDGELNWEICEDLANRLTELLPLLPVGEGGGHIGNWRDTTSKFIDGLRLAYSKKENVGFY